MRLLFALLVACVLAMSDARAQPAPDHSGWDRLLGRYVVESPDGINRVRYEAWTRNANDRAALDAYIESLEATRVSSLPRNAQFAFWVNLYNAVTVDVILDAYPVSSIRSIRPTLISIGPWDANRVTVEGRELSLNDIEHRVLRRQWSEPRIHYAVNCASMGCPNLMARAWRAETLNADLDAAARAYINHDRGVEVGTSGLTLSRIYRWYREDFGSEAELRAHLMRYAEPAKRAALEQRPIVSYDYDWSLNDAR